MPRPKQMASGSGHDKVAKTKPKKSQKTATQLATSSSAIYQDPLKTTVIPRKLVSLCTSTVETPIKLVIDSTDKKKLYQLVPVSNTDGHLESQKTMKELLRLSAAMHRYHRATLSARSGQGK